MTTEGVLATIEAEEILRNRIDGGGTWLSIPEVGRAIRISAILRLEDEARKALTGAGAEAPSSETCRRCRQPYQVDDSDAWRFTVFCSRTCELGK